MNWWQALILGIVQGLTEFLPVSSSGHLVLTRAVLGINGEYMMFDVMLHVGTLCAIAVVFFKDIIDLFKPPFKTMGLIILSAVPAGIVGLLCDDIIEGFFSSAKYLCFFFLFTAFIMLATEWFAKRNKKPQPLGIKNAAFMGIMQAVAVFPGISRSGSTIFGGTVAGTEREKVAKFSFLMSAPIILGSALLEAFKVTPDAAQIPNVIIGMVASFLCGLAAIKLMLKVIKKANYKWFALYLFVISILSFVFIFLRS